jgi:hypothetical protein
MWGMRASAGTASPDRGRGSDPTVVVTVRRRLPRPVVWLLWLLGALLGSVVIGFLAGLTRPREPDPWSPGEPPGPAPQTAPSSDPSAAPAEDE